MTNLYPYTPEMATESAARGASLMDEVCPGWTLLLDLKRLDLAKEDSCILGQTAHCVTEGDAESNTEDSYDLALAALSDNHWELLEKLGLDPDSNTGGTSCTFGFSVIYPAVYYNTKHPGIAKTGRLLHGGRACKSEIKTRYEMLNIAWREEIRKRGEA